MKKRGRKKRSVDLCKISDGGTVNFGVEDSVDIPADREMVTVSFGKLNIHVEASNKEDQEEEQQVVEEPVRRATVIDLPTSSEIEIPSDLIMLGVEGMYGEEPSVACQLCWHCSNPVDPANPKFMVLKYNWVNDVYAWRGSFDTWACQKRYSVCFYRNHVHRLLMLQAHFLYRLFGVAAPVNMAPLHTQQKKFGGSMSKEEFEEKSQCKFDEFEVGNRLEFLTGGLVRIKEPFGKRRMPQ